MAIAVTMARVDRAQCLRVPSMRCTASCSAHICAPSGKGGKRQKHDKTATREDLIARLKAAASTASNGSGSESDDSHDDH